MQPPPTVQERACPVTASHSVGAGLPREHRPSGAIPHLIQPLASLCRQSGSASLVLTSGTAKPPVQRNLEAFSPSKGSAGAQACWSGFRSFPTCGCVSSRHCRCAPS